MRRSARITAQLLGVGALTGGLAIGLHVSGLRAGCSSTPALASTSAVAPPAPAPPPAPAGVLDPSLPAAPRLAALGVPDRLDIARSAAGSFVGVDDDLLLAPIGAGKPVHFKMNRGGSSISFRVDFDNGARAAFKPDQTDNQTVPRYEIAAYRINRLLGMARVSPSIPKVVRYDDIVNLLDDDSRQFLPRIQSEVLRQPNGDVYGEAQWWIPVVKDLKLDTNDGIRMWWGWLTVGTPIPPEDEHMAEQMSTLLFFDFLINNPDRFSGGNALGDDDGYQLFYMDNTLAFRPEPHGDERCRKYLAMSEKYSRSLYVALENMSESDLRAALDASPQAPWPLLTDAEIQGVMGRRQYLLDYIGGLIEVFGEREVLAFP